MATGASAEQQSPATGTVVIKVTAGAAPVAGASVSAGGERQTMSATGEATLVLSVGERTVTVEKAGFLTQTFALTPVGGRRGSIRWSGRHGITTAAGLSTRGRRSRGSS